MRRQRTASLYSNRHPSKQHCPEDQSCGACCSCVEILKKKNKVLLDKNKTFGKEKDDYIKQIMRLNKVIKEWEKRAKEFQNFEEVKRKLRKEIKAEMEDQHRVDDMVLRQKLASYKKDKESLQREKGELLQSVENFEKRFEKISSDYRKMEQMYNDLQKEFDQLKDISSKDKESIAELKRRVVQLDSAIQDKTNVITKIQKSLSAAQQNYLLQKAKNSDNELALRRTKQQIKAYSSSIESLKKQSAQLTLQNGKLDKLVKDLDSTIASYGILEGQLRNRILVSENYATQKEIEAKVIQSDFYEALYRRSI